MEIYQLKTFSAVAREGSVTRASEHLHLSQPAVSAHIKALEETLGLALFERTSRGMRLTSDGQRLLAKVDLALDAHRALITEATRLKGRLTGRLCLGVDANSSTDVVGHCVTTLSDRCPDVEVSVRQSDSRSVVAGICNGSLDAGFYNEALEAENELTTMEVSQFGIYLAAPVGLAAASRPLNWNALSDVPWVCPTSNTCCGRAAEDLFVKHGIRPKRIISVDRESVTSTLVAAGVGVGLLHAYTAKKAEARGDVELVCQVEAAVRVLFGYLPTRAEDPLLEALVAILEMRER